MQSFSQVLRGKEREESTLFLCFKKKYKYTLAGKTMMMMMMMVFAIKKERNTTYIQWLHEHRCCTQPNSRTKKFYSLCMSCCSLDMYINIANSRTMMHPLTLPSPHIKKNFSSCSIFFFFFLFIIND